MTNEKAIEYLNNHYLVGDKEQNEAIFAAIKALSRLTKRKNSREKGKNGELQVAHLFQEYGFKAERGQQHDGRSGHADVVGVPGIWIEAKRDEHLNIDEAIQQAERDCRALDDDDIIPIVVHRKNREAWSVTMRLFDLLFMCGNMPFSTMETDGLVTMRFDEWIKVFLEYNERCENAEY